MIAEGEENNLKMFLDAINIRNALINIESLETEYSRYTGDYADFYKLMSEGEIDERLDKASEHLKEIIVVMKDGFGNLDSKMGTMI